MDRVGAIRRVLPAVTSTLAAVATALLAISCGAPFTVDLLAHAEDTTPPVVVLSSPDNQSYYAKTVTVTGQATDLTDTEGVAGIIGSVRYEIPAASIVETVAILPDGAFSFSFSTTAFTGGTISFQVIATDLNANEGIVSISLLYGGSDIATFQAIPDNQRVLLQWDPVPTATGYIVRNLGGAAEVALAADQSSYTWSDLDNGSQYFFQLEATDGSGETNVSDDVSVIPLSPYTLLPTVESYADRAVISWRDVPGVTRYVVEKAEDIAGPYFKRFETAETTVEDTLLARDQFYYYRIYPESQDEIRSAAVEAILLPFSVTGAEPGNYFGPMTAADRIMSYGDYIYVSDKNIDNEILLLTLDATDPGNLVQIAELNTDTEEYLDWVLDEDEQLIYVTRNERGILVIDVSTPANPQVATMGALNERWIGAPDDSTFQSIGINRIGLTTYLFGVEGNSNLYAARVDRAGPEAGAEVTLVSTSWVLLDGDDGDDAGAMAITGGTAYVGFADTSANEQGFVKVDLSTPETALPVTTGYMAAPGGTYHYGAEAIAVSGNVVYLEFRTDYTPAPDPPTYAIRAVDADTFSLLATIDFNEQVRDLMVHNDILYASAQSDGVRGYDISSPPGTNNPAPIVEPDMAGPASESVVQGESLVVAAIVGVESFRLLPTIGYGSGHHVIDSSSFIRDFAAVGTNAHVLSYYDFHTADVTDPMTLSGLSTVGGVTIDTTTQLLLQGDRELVVGRDEVAVLAAPSATAPSEISTFTHNASRFTSIGDVSYGIKGSIVSIFDTSDSSAITQIRAIGFDVDIADLNARGNYLYATYLEPDYIARDSGIIVLDISDPIYPTEVKRIPAGTDIALHETTSFGDYLFCAYSDNGGTYQDGADDESGLVVYDIRTDPDTPIVAGTYVGNTVFSAAEDWTRRYQLVDVSGHLVVLSSGYKLGGGYTYSGRIVLLNVADLSNIVKIKDILPDGYVDPPGGAPAPDYPRGIMFWRGAYLFVASNQAFAVYEM